MFDYEPFVGGRLCFALAVFVGYCVINTIAGWF